MAAPAGTPPPVLSQLNQALRRALDAPAVRAGLVRLGVVGVANSREDIARQWADEARAWSRFVKETGVTIE